MGRKFQLDLSKRICHVSWITNDNVTDFATQIRPTNNIILLSIDCLLRNKLLSCGMHSNILMPLPSCKLPTWHNTHKFGVITQVEKKLSGALNYKYETHFTRCAAQTQRMLYFNTRLNHKCRVQQRCIVLRHVSMRWSISLQYLFQSQN
jgi:hypothetical protein